MQYGILCIYQYCIMYLVGQVDGVDVVEVFIVELFVQFVYGGIGGLLLVVWVLFGLVWMWM